MRLPCAGAHSRGDAVDPGGDACHGTGRDRIGGAGRRPQRRERLKKDLPAGRYVTITRAQTPNGLVERNVHKKLGILKRFRLR